MGIDRNVSLDPAGGSAPCALLPKVRYVNSGDNWLGGHYAVPTVSWKQLPLTIMPFWALGSNAEVRAQ